MRHELNHAAIPHRVEQKVLQKDNTSLTVLRTKPTITRPSLETQWLARWTGHAFNILSRDSKDDLLVVKSCGKKSSC